MTPHQGFFSEMLPQTSTKRAGEDPMSVLRRIFGYESFRSIQEDVVSNACAGSHTFALMTTGAGKSLCYQVPALHLKGMTIVISPLVSLMKDQVDALRKKGVRAAALNSNMSRDEIHEVGSAVSDGSIDLLYVAPERLSTSGFQRTVARSRAPISLVVVDESHVLVSWGKDFRPDYANIGDFIRQFPEAAVMAVTATASPAQVAEILERLGIPDTDVMATSFDRPNIEFDFDDRLREADLPRLLEGRGDGSAIVFCPTKRKVEELAESLTARGIPALPYHAGLPVEVKTRNQDRFLTETGSVVVATVAFGMGIDKADGRVKSRRGDARPHRRAFRR